MKNKLGLLEVALIIAPFLAIALLWKQIPQRLPMHWNLRGEIDGWSASRAEILIMPLISLGVIALMRTLSWLDPKLLKTIQPGDRMHAILQILRVAIAGLFLAIFTVQLATALGYGIGGQAMMAILLLFFAIMGNYLGNLRPNYFVGIRTPWTLESATTWRATHRLGGRLVFFGSLALLILQFFLRPQTFGVLFVGFALLFVLWAFIYSWYHFRTHGAPPETA